MRISDWSSDVCSSDLGFGGATPTIDDAMAIVLAALSLLGLGIFGPGIASGIVSAGPQLSAGAAVGTGLAAGGVVALGAGAVSAATTGGASLADREIVVWGKRGYVRGDFVGGRIIK